MSSYEELYNNICRMCLFQDKNENMVPLIDQSKNLTHYGKAVLMFANIYIRPSDNLPPQMCQRCLYLLKQAIYFKLNCESSDKKLKTLLDVCNRSLDSFKEKLVEYTMYRVYFSTETMNNLPEQMLNNENLSEKRQRLSTLAKKVLKSTNKNIKTDKHSDQESKVINCIEFSKNNVYIDNKTPAKYNKSETHDIYDQIPQITLEDEPNVDMLLDTLDEMVGKHSDTLNSDIKPSVNVTKRRQKKVLRRRKFLRYKWMETQSELIKKSRVSKLRRSLTCKICRKVLANQHTYDHHMQRHNGFRFICEHCGKGFPVGAELKIHQIARHGTGPYLQCQHCTFKAPRKIDLIEHIRIHTGERPYTCDKCGLTFRRRAIWKKHLIYHMEKKVQCTKCPRKFHQRSEMLAHVNNVHDRVYVYLCNKCGVTYAKPATVRRHLTERHGIPREMQGKVIRVNKGSNPHSVTLK